MKKPYVFAALFFLTVLTACVNNKEAAIVPPPTQTPAPQVELETVTNEDGLQHSVAVCTAQSSAPAEDLRRDGDWVMGVEEDYSVTIIEYGDYQ